MPLQETINVHNLLNKLDWTIFTAILLLTLATVVYSFIKQKKINKITTTNKNNLQLTEYLIMGRQLTLPLFVATLSSTWYGNIFGVAQIAFEHGVYNFITQGLFWYASYIAFAIFFVKKIRKYNSLTLPDLIKNIFGEKSAKFSAILIFFKTLPITHTIGIAILLQLIFNISFSLAAILGVCFVLIYSLFGGFRAVVLSDLIQCICMIVGIISVVCFSYSTFGGINFLITKLPPSHFSFSGNHNAATPFVWLLIACSTTFINPAFYQRCFAAKSDKTAIYGILCSLFIWIIIDCCITAGGMYAFATIPKSQPINAYLTYSMQILPNGWKGLFLAAVAATILSTLDSFLLISANTLFFDLPVLRNININVKHIYSLMLTSIITISLAIYYEGKIENVWLNFKSYFSACLLFPLIIGYYLPKKISDNQFIIACSAGCISFSLWGLFNRFYNTNIADQINSFYVGNLATLCIFFYYVYKNKQNNLLST